MIAYLDTSALVELYLDEVGSVAVASCVERSAAVTTARVTYAEARAALAERHALRGCDAIQLAAALEVRGAGADLEFVSFDRRLSQAASRERLPLLPIPPPPA